DVKLLAAKTNNFKAQQNIAAIFLKNNQAYQEGERLVQKNLANTLKKIAEQGPGVFYQGEIAKTIVQESQKSGGVLSLKDFAEYSAEELTPVHCTYHGYNIISA